MRCVQSTASEEDILTLVQSMQRSATAVLNLQLEPPKSQTLTAPLDAVEMSQRHAVAQTD